MKQSLAVVCLVVAFALSALAQSVSSNVYAAGISFNHSGSPEIAGTGLYARALDQKTGTYAFTVLDTVPNTLKPFTVDTEVSAGVAQKVFTLGKIPIYVPTAAGVSFNGSNTGWAWSTGGMGAIHLKGKWYAFPTLRILKSSVSNGSGYQPIVSVLFGGSF